ncbi:unnamed protein product, partial [Prunus brigantina]
VPVPNPRLTRCQKNKKKSAEARKGSPNSSLAEGLKASRTLPYQRTSQRLRMFTQLLPYLQKVDATSSLSTWGTRECPTAPARSKML